MLVLHGVMAFIGQNVRKQPGNDHSKIGHCRKDYYDVLQVPKGAPDSLIKRSYRKLALQYHPVRTHQSSSKAQAYPVWLSAAEPRHAMAACRTK